MRQMPVIVYNEDGFKNPVFQATYVVDMDDEIETKLEIAHFNESQVYEWLPYTHGETAPEGDAARREWLKGMNITDETTDEEILSAPRGYAVRFAKTAARFRKELIERMGEEKGKAVRYAEAYEICPYGGKLTDEIRKEIFEF
jgi:hypothetical protein